MAWFNINIRVSEASVGALCLPETLLVSGAMEANCGSRGVAMEAN